MAKHPTPLHRFLDRLVAQHATVAASDAVLLGRFISDRDELAFAEMVRRHGSMVLSVCRRVLGDAHLAEDTAQAAWLTLARKAPGIQRPDALAAWLHGVARQLALNARRDQRDAKREKRKGLRGVLP